MSRGWAADDVRSMEGDRVQFAHVARHLYREAERWDQVVPGLGNVRARAWGEGCAPAVLETPHPDCYLASEACRKHVLGDHDRHLAPAYRRELHAAEAASRFGQLGNNPRGWAFVGEGGVLVIVREVGADRGPEVKTAYRVVPGQREAPSSQDFFKAAVRKLRDKSSWKGGGT